MIFAPYPDERNVINTIHKYRNEDYALLRMTYTMIDKNNLDANGILRDLLKKWGLVDFDLLEYGGKYGVTYDALFIQEKKTETVKLKFYRVANARGDRRFSIEKVKSRAFRSEINVGDLLYISVFKKPEGSPQIFFINLTNNVPDGPSICAAIGTDEITQKFEEIKPKLQMILKGGFFDNIKGAGAKAPKDEGDTLEALLGIETNNRKDADYEGVIEVKSKGEGRTLDTLFTLRPCFEGTRVAEYEKNDKNRVAAFARLYGYDSDKHPDCSSLYITIGSVDAPQNNQGFFLSVDDENGMVDLMWINPKTGKREKAAYWSFEDLKTKLYQKHPSTLWVKAESREENGMVQFRYKEIEFSRAPQFTTFLSMIKSGTVTYDWRGYVAKEGKYRGKNHGNAWRIKPYAKTELFGEMEKVRM